MIREVIVAKKKTFGETSQEVSVEPLDLSCRQFPFIIHCITLTAKMKSLLIHTFTGRSLVQAPSNCLSLERKDHTGKEIS